MIGDYVPRSQLDLKAAMKGKTTEDMSDEELRRWIDPGKERPDSEVSGKNDPGKVRLDSETSPVENSPEVGDAGDE